MTKAVMKQSCIFFLALSLLASASSADKSQPHLAGFDLQPLTNLHWAIPIEGTACQESATNCTLLFGLRQVVTLCPDGAFACLAQNGSATTLGGEPTIAEKTDGEGFELNYESKETTERTIIEFTCEADAKLKTDSQLTFVGRFVPRSTARLNNGYRIGISSAIGCKKREGLGAGSQLMIILLVLFLVYFCGGMVYNHVNGARGEELIPHHWFWKNFPSYVVDGCIFVVRLITCQTRENYSQNPDYGSTSAAGVSPSGRTYETL